MVEKGGHWPNRILQEQKRGQKQKQVDNLLPTKLQVASYVTAIVWVQLNKYETDRYFLQNFQCTTMLIHEFCKICDHEIVLQECKSKQKQLQVHNSYKTRE